MAAVSAGRVLLIPKGEWDNGTTYDKLDWVRYNEDVYVCDKNGTIGVEPGTDDEYWKLLVRSIKLEFETEPINFNDWT